MRPSPATVWDECAWNAPKPQTRESDLRLHVVARGGVEPPTFRFSVGRSYQLSYLALTSWATPTGLEPATSAVTGRRANQLRYGASWMRVLLVTAYPQRDSNPCYRRERAGS